jgi:hypothetical protein
VNWNAKIIEEFRANAGKVGGFFNGQTLLLIHTTGARSGEARVNPVMYKPGRANPLIATHPPKWLSSRAVW